MNTTTVALAVIVVGALCSGCDRRSTQTSDGEALPNTEARPWTAARDCVTESVQRHFETNATDIQMARLAVKACEEEIAKAERVQGLAQSVSSPTE